MQLTERLRITKLEAWRFSQRLSSRGTERLATWSELALTK
jgi:hypothetical protein